MRRSRRAAASVLLVSGSLCACTRPEAGEHDAAATPAPASAVASSSAAPPRSALPDAGARIEDLPGFRSDWVDSCVDPSSLQDGIYAPAPAGRPGRFAAALPGVAAGETLTAWRTERIAFTRPILHARDNANSSFVLSVDVPARWYGPALVLAVCGRAVAARSAGSDGGATVRKYFEMGPNIAEKIAASLGIERRTRRKLGDGLRARFSVRESYDRSGPIEIALELENAGSQPLGFRTGGAYRGSGRDNRFSFTVLRGGAAGPDRGTTRNFGGFTKVIDLKPGDRHQETVDLRSWAAFAEPGDYEVRCRYELELGVSPMKSSEETAHERWDAVAVQTVRVVVK